MKRRNILMSLAAFPALAMSKPLFISENLEASNQMYTIIFALDNLVDNVTIYCGTKEQIKEELLRPYRLSYCQGRKCNFIMRKGTVNVHILKEEIEELGNYIKRQPVSFKKLPHKYLRGMIRFKESSVLTVLDKGCDMVDKYC